MELTVEKLVYGGDGLARLPAGGDARRQTVLVPFVLPGELIEATLRPHKPGFARARADRIVSPSAWRVAPPCSYFLRCGGCHYQHAGYAHQVEIKAEILRETLRRIGKIEWTGEIRQHPSPPWNYRNRTRMKLRSQPFALGYYKLNSHELLPVAQCPISSPLINRAIAALWEIGRGGHNLAEISEIGFVVNHDDTELMLELFLSGNVSHERLLTLGGSLRGLVPQVTGVAFFDPQTGETLKKLPAELQTACGGQALLYHTSAGDYRVSAGSFFQANRFMIDALLALVTQGESGGSAIDLYAGTGLFSRALANRFQSVVAVEGAPSAFSDLQHNAPSNVRARSASTDKFLDKFRHSDTVDLVVVDPPRAGLGEKTAQKLAALGARQITYVSCEPSTLSRDLKTLLQSGYRMDEVHLMDLFPQSYHMESVVKLVR